MNSSSKSFLSYFFPSCSVVAMFTTMYDLYKHPLYKDRFLSTRYIRSLFETLFVSGTANVLSSFLIDQFTHDNSPTEGEFLIDRSAGCYSTKVIANIASAAMIATVWEIIRRKVLRAVVKQSYRLYECFLVSKIEEEEEFEERAIRRDKSEFELAKEEIALPINNTWLFFNRIVSKELLKRVETPEDLYVFAFHHKMLCTALLVENNIIYEGKNLSDGDKYLMREAADEYDNDAQENIDNVRALAVNFVPLFEDDRVDVGWDQGLINHFRVCSMNINSAIENKLMACEIRKSIEEEEYFSSKLDDYFTPKESTPSQKLCNIVSVVFIGGVFANLM